MSTENVRSPAASCSKHTVGVVFFDRAFFGCLESEGVGGECDGSVHVLVTLHVCCLTETTEKTLPLDGTTWRPSVEGNTANDEFDRWF